jgi:hypothetical protein
MKLLQVIVSLMGVLPAIAGAIIQYHEKHITVEQFVKQFLTIIASVIPDAPTAALMEEHGEKQLANSVKAAA